MSDAPTMPVTETPPTGSKARPKWESEARERLRSQLRSAQRILPPLIARDAVEGDTRAFVEMFLTDAFGYDRFQELTQEYQVRGEFADFGVRIDKQLVAFVEVKRATTKLGAKHLRQVATYAINEGVEWAVLTNGQDWEVYHLAPAPPRTDKTISTGPLVQVDLTFEVDLLGEAAPSKKIDLLLYLSRESMKRHQIDDLWKARRATSPKSLATVVCSERVVDAIRRELRRRTGHNAEPTEIRELLKTTVVRPDCL